MSFMDRIRSWWRSDTAERAQEAGQVPTEKRGEPNEDYEARKDEQFVEEHLGLDGVDFERDSEPPSHS
jgi:hypothetical protein